MTEGADALQRGVAPMATRIGGVLLERGEQMAVAESLTGGRLAAGLASASAASQWFRGGVVAYQPEIKQSVLGVTPGPVVNSRTASEMVGGVATLLQADLAIAVTGVGGPGPEEGQPAGTVWAGTRYRGETSTHLLRLDGDPSKVCLRTCYEALALALGRLQEAPAITRPDPVGQGAKE